MKRLLSVVGLGGIILLGMCSCSKKQETKAVTKPQGLVLVDVNMPEVYTDAHIKDALLLETDRLKDTTKEWDRATELVVYCTDSRCSEKYNAYDELVRLGFTNVRVFPGGIHEFYQLSLTEPRYVRWVVGQKQNKFLQRALGDEVKSHHAAPVITALELLEKLEKFSS